MKKLIATLAAVAAGLHSYAQETVERIVKDPSRPGTEEIFTVLKSNKRIKHGPYKKINGQQQLVASGFYKQNKKDSTWEEYNYNGARLLSRGNYLNDEKTGVWEYYEYAGEAMHKYDHTTKQLVAHTTNPGDSLYAVYVGNEIKNVVLDQPPILIGGSPVVQHTLLTNMRYPADAIRSGTSGTVVVAFDIDTDGSVTNYHVKGRVDPALDQEALRVVKLVPRNWVPGVKDGRKVKVQMKQSVVFRMR